MPTPPTTTTAQRTMQARRTRMRRRAPGSAVAEGNRSSGDSEGKPEESEVTAGLVNSECRVLHPISRITIQNVENDMCDIAR